MWIAGMLSDGIYHEEKLFSLPQLLRMLPAVTVITQLGKDGLAALLSLAMFPSSTLLF
jgi:hypothetical protein